MRVATVKSTTLLTIAYNRARKQLPLEFCSGAVYLYFGVPDAVHQALLQAPSKGRYFNQSIRACFPYSRVGGLPAAATNPEVKPGCQR